ncbi:MULTISPECIES: TonB-dependent receptor [unclassified Pseudoalteromonas]|uniref:TonB-dependent receptor n=1 Tax=unclassified Pseudoalteromonas TaxID=194690 RepID=UPI0020974D6B|nr:TonB-dependent receptor [Pseudoalteromonas sp. XMcav2-N]MCO7190514.1 TonB-dependent receptor [Pseudoalteromonas sp. XMcav2-N]
MKTQLRKTALSLAIAACVGASGAAYANDTASAVKGQITGPNGNPAVGTKITIIHTPSGSVKTTTVGENGSFSAKGLRVGGPYQIIVDSDSFEDTMVEDVYLSLGKTYPVTVQLQSKSQMEQIVVTGRPITMNSGGTGPATNFSLADLQEKPAINRDLKDIVRTDPRIFVDESNSGAIQCAGGNPRFNSLTVDGVRMNDNFGLNSNGYPTERMPFSFDTIAQVAVELAPFDVQYGGFTSCNINAVTKSGTNEIHGGVFFDYTSDSLSGDKIEGAKQDLGDYDEKRYGFNVGMPLIEDTLFLFTSYEKLEGSQVFEYTPFANGKIELDEINEIIDISKSLYDYDPGSMIPSMPVEDEKILIKLDWNINEMHRASFVYNYNDGFSLSQSDSSSDRMSLSNHFYERGAELNSYVATVYSDWTDDFSTEVRVGYSKLDNRQNSLDAASGFGEMQIYTDDVTVYIGPDDSRQANKLKYDNLSLKLAGTYYLDAHEISFGYEMEELDVFNMFVQHNEGEHRFFGGIEDFRNGVARVYYGNASSHNPIDAAGEFKYALNTLYVQDKFDLEDYEISITAGLRYDWYTSSDVPTLNKNFYNPDYVPGGTEPAGRFQGLHSNQQNLDGVSLLQPRLGFNWVYNDQLELRGGIGLYSGGNPNVWISNSYSNDGIRNIQINQKNMQLLGPDAVAFVGNGKAGYAIPKDLYDAVGSGTADASTNVTDADFEIPSEWKYSLGATYVTEEDYVFTVDYLYTHKQNSAIVRNLALVRAGTAPDGRPIYSDDLHPRNSDFLLTNVKGEDAYSHILSFGMNKSFDNGIDLAMSYAYTVSKDVHPMTSSVAFSNYHFFATANPEAPNLSTSNYEVPHRATLSLSYKHEFIDGYETKFNLFGQASVTNPYSYTFDNTGMFGFADTERDLLYVPNIEDNAVQYGADFDKAAFDAWVEREGLARGQVLDRNSQDGEWWVTFDLKVEQEFAGFADGHKGSAFFTIKNLGNLLNDDWGVMETGSAMQNAVTARITEAGRYEFVKFNDPSGTDFEVRPSLWEIRVGVKYDF